MSVTRIAVRAHAPDVDASVSFYEKLRFAVQDDEVNGNGTRTVKMAHPELSNVWLLLRDAPELARGSTVDPAAIPELMPVLFTLVVTDYLEWTDHLARVGVPLFARASHPWGVWLIVKDPGGNLVSISTFDRF
jgi:hypothetical protein